MRQLDGTCSWPSNCYLACFEGTIPEGRWQEPILLFCVYLWDGLRSQENFFKLKFHFFKSKNELFCFYCLYQGSFPTIAQVLTEVVSPTQLPRQFLNWKCVVSRHPESFCSLIDPLFTVPRVSKYTTRAVIVSTAFPPQGMNTCTSEQGSRLSLQTVAPRTWTPACLHTGWVFLFSPVWGLIWHKWKSSSPYSCVCSTGER